MAGDPLDAVFDRLIPADDWPAVSTAGLHPYLERLALDEPERVARIRAVAAAVAAGGTDPDRLDASILALDHGDRDLLVQGAARAYYGDRDGAGARMIGFRPGGGRDPGAAVSEPELATTDFTRVPAGLDVVVVGAGAGGGVAACVLAEAGLSVLVVDRGPVLRAGEIGRDHLRNHRSSVHGHNTGPGPEVRVVVGRSGREREVTQPHDPRWHNNAMVVGGGTRVYQGMAWRFLPTDFAMASAYGVPDGSSLADWPVGYDDLAPHYEWVEWQVGVCGDPTAHRAGGPIPNGYPMPPLPANTEAAVLARGAAALGLAVGPVPLLLNSVPHDGRARCVRCGECVGFSCPVDAKNGTHNTVLPRALAAGAALVERCRARRITVGRSGRVTGVELVDEITGAVVEVRARHVVVAAGAIETARLLLASAGDHHPAGLGNAHDQVGRHLQGHGFVSAFGRYDDEVIDPDGPGVSIATLDLAHGNDGIVGGGVLANEIVKLPIVHWNWALRPDAPRWGPEAKEEMRRSYRRTGHLFGQIQEIPRPDNRVTLAGVADRLGMPAARLEGAAHAETLRAAAFLGSVGEAWHRASGAVATWLDRIPDGLLAGQHQSGTCRMGADPTQSVVDATGRVHGHDNLWVADASVHVTNGAVNPVLTIMALAHRTAGFLVSDLRVGGPGSVGAPGTVPRPTTGAW